MSDELTPDERGWNVYACPLEMHSPTLAALRIDWYGRAVLAELGVQDAS